MNDESHDTVDTNWILDFLDLATDTVVEPNKVETTTVEIVNGSNASYSESLESVSQLSIKEEDEIVGNVGEELSSKNSVDQHEEDEEKTISEQDTTNSPTVIPQSQEDQENSTPSLEQQPSLANFQIDAQGLTPEPINFVDCFQRTFACPFHSIKTWKVSYCQT